MSNETIELVHELGQNFIDYAMTVNSDRSIPDSTTGLKPVHKRILYCALTEGHTSNKKYVKCANNVGSMLAYWHPHGDSSVYSALVRLAQPWVMRYPLIDFHGNLGNQGGDGPAHYRYTEYRLSKLAEDGLLNGVKRHAVLFEPNFDETKEEPINLPAVFPSLLCNPNSGIGVALACSWACHNLNEVANAIYDYLDGKEPMLPGPDFPTGGIIINKNDIPKIMEMGKGTVKIRAKYHIEDNTIVFTEIPYGVTTESILDELNALADKEQLEGVKEIRNESNKKGLRIVLECKKDAVLSKIINNVFQNTNLQSSFSYNQVALVNKEPKLLNLKQSIEIYVKHNLDCIVREHEFELQQKKDRLEIVNGLLVALEDIDNVIALIKASESSTKAKEALIAKYSFSEPQAKAIIEMKLGKLAGLEKIELQTEQQGLMDEIDYINDILTHVDVQITILKSRLNSLVKKYGDERRTELTQIDISKNPKEQIVADPKDCVVVVSNRGIVKRVDAKLFKPQKRNTIGTKTNEEIVAFSQKTNTQDALMIFTSKGKMYKILVDNIPESKLGVAISSLVELDDSEIPMAYTTCMKDNNKKFIFFATKDGIIKKVPLKDYDTIKRTGVVAIKFRDGDELAAVTFIDDEEVIMATKNGAVIRIATSEMPISSRIAQGVKGMNVADGDKVIAALPITDVNSSLVVVTTNNLGKKIDLKDLITQNRGGRGVLCAKSEVAGVTLVNDNDKIVVRGNNSAITINSTEIPILSRTSIGNVMLKNNNKVIYITKV